MNFNRIILCGRLTRDPQLKYLPSNVAVCEFGLAINERRKEKEIVTFVDVAAFGSLAENVNRYLAKGCGCLIEGRLKLDQWTAQDGTKRSKLSVIADAVQLGSGREHDDAAPERRGGSHSAPPVDDVAPARAEARSVGRSAPASTSRSATPATRYANGAFHPASDVPNYIDEALAAGGREPVAVGADDDRPPPTGDEIPF